MIEGGSMPALRPFVPLLRPRLAKCARRGDGRKRRAQSVTNGPLPSFLPFPPLELTLRPAVARPAHCYMDLGWLLLNGERAFGTRRRQPTESGHQSLSRPLRHLTHLFSLSLFQLIKSHPNVATDLFGTTVKQAISQV